MPGYKGHLIGGCVAYGFTLAGLLSLRPLVLMAGQSSLITYVPSMIVSAASAFHIYFPSIVMTKSVAVHNFWPQFFVLFEWFLLTIAGSLFPDIDIKSKGQKWLYWILLFIFFALIGKKRFDVLAILSILALTPMLVNHRGLFHRLWFIALFSFGIWCWFSIQFPFLSQTLFFDMIFFLIGAISHLWLDMGFKKMLRF